jgi:zinc transport system ATP-binding protein
MILMKFVVSAAPPRPDPAAVSSPDAASASPPDVIRARGASIGYRDHVIVHEADLTVRPGEVIALIGANGSGKTTLVRGLLDLADLSAGQVELFGTPAARFQERYRIGYVPQRHTVGGAIPSTVREVVTSGRLPHIRWWSRTTDSDRRTVASAIDTVGLTDYACTPVGQLSGGQQRRTLIARALAAEPEVMIMDEPTAGVDTHNQENLVRTLARLVDSGLTLLIVTHDIAPLRPLLTRVIAMENGRIVRDVPADEATTHLDCNDCGHDDEDRDPASHRHRLLGNAGIG